MDQELQPSRLKRWLELVLIVDFDAEAGHALRACYPSRFETLSTSILEAICRDALPEFVAPVSHGDQNGSRGDLSPRVEAESNFCFTYSGQDCGLSTSSQLKNSDRSGSIEDNNGGNVNSRFPLLFCFANFCSLYHPNYPRQTLQRSVVVASRSPTDAAFHYELAETINRYSIDRTPLTSSLEKVCDFLVRNFPPRSLSAAKVTIRVPDTSFVFQGTLKCNYGISLPLGRQSGAHSSISCGGFAPATLQSNFSAPDCIKREEDLQELLGGNLGSSSSSTSKHDNQEDSLYYSPSDDSDTGGRMLMGDDCELKYTREGDANTREEDISKGDRGKDAQGDTRNKDHQKTVCSSPRASPEDSGTCVLLCSCQGRQQLNNSRTNGLLHSSTALLNAMRSIDCLPNSFTITSPITVPLPLVSKRSTGISLIKSLHNLTYMILNLWDAFISADLVVIRSDKIHLSSNTVLALPELIRPLDCVCYVRPQINMFQKDYTELTRADLFKRRYKSQESDRHGAIFGVTNPLLASEMAHVDVSLGLDVPCEPLFVPDSILQCPKLVTLERFRKSMSSESSTTSSPLLSWSSYFLRRLQPRESGVPSNWWSSSFGAALSKSSNNSSSGLYFSTVSKSKLSETLRKSREQRGWPNKRRKTFSYFIAPGRKPLFSLAVNLLFLNACGINLEDHLAQTEEFSKQECCLVHMEDINDDLLRRGLTQLTEDFLRTFDTYTEYDIRPLMFNPFQTPLPPPVFSAKKFFSRPIDSFGLFQRLSQSGFRQLCERFTKTATFRRWLATQKSINEQLTELKQIEFIIQTSIEIVPTLTTQELEDGIIRLGWLVAKFSTDDGLLLPSSTLGIGQDKLDLLTKFRKELQAVWKRRMIPFHTASNE